MAWGDYRNGPREHYGLILAALMKTSDELPAKRAMIEQLKAKYGEIAKLNAVWETKFEGWDALEKPVALEESRGAAVQADLSILLRDWAERYYRIVFRCSRPSGSDRRVSLRLDRPRHV